VRVLIAEQDAELREDFKEMIEASGHECLLARDGIEGWQLYQSTPKVDVVMSDRAIPGIDGWSCAAGSAGSAKTATPTSFSSRPPKTKRIRR